MDEVKTRRLVKWMRAWLVPLSVAALSAGGGGPAWADAAPPAAPGPVSGRGAAGDAPVDKSGYTLFNPTPRHLMRDLSPDRPDVTESPHTVDAGHVQVELSFVEWGKGDGAEVLNVLPANVKVGLTSFADVQFVFAPYNRARAAGRTDAGAADALVRLKLNLWGNDEGDTALAVMPFVSFPTGADAFTAGAAEGGIIVPLTLPLPAESAVTLMAEVDFVRDGTGGRDTLFVHTASVGRDLTDRLGGYVEYVGVVDLDGDLKYEAYANGGFTYTLSDDLQLDAGVKFGLTAPAEDLRVFAGMTFRL